MAPPGALTTLQDRLLEVRLLEALSPVRGGSMPAKHEDALAAQAVNRACVVLLCGSLEGFAEDLLLEALEALMRQGVSMTGLAPYLVQRHAEKQVRDLAVVTDTSKSSRA